jgi:hypothetical protein
MVRDTVHPYGDSALPRYKSSAHLIELSSPYHLPFVSYSSDSVIYYNLEEVSNRQSDLSIRMPPNRQSMLKQIDSCVEFVRQEPDDYCRIQSLKNLGEFVISHDY